MQLSDRVEVERLRPVPPSIGGFGASGIGTMAAAGLTPHGRPREAFVALYARWIGAHPCTMSPTKASDISAHRILSDFSVLIGHEDPPRHRILAAGDLNMFYGATGLRWSLPEREGTRWDRFETLGLEFLGPQAAERPAAIVATTGCSRHTTSPNSARRPKPTVSSTTISCHEASTKGSRSVPSTGPANGAKATIVGFWTRLPPNEATCCRPAQYRCRYEPRLAFAVWFGARVGR